MAPLFPRSGPGESSSPMSQVLLASRSAYPVAYLFRFRAPRDPPCFVSRNLRSRKARGTFLARSLFTRRPNQPVCSHVDVNGISQVPRRSVPCLCLALRPRPNRQSLATHTVSSLLPPRFPRRRLQRLMNFGAQSRGFSTRCLRFKTGVATTPARLASGWLARLYREGVEPSGSLQKVSDRSLILLFWIYPGAREVSWLKPSAELAARVGPTVDRPRAPQVSWVHLMLAAKITLPHFLVSSEMSLAKSAGEPASTVPPRLASRALNFGSAMLTLTSLFSLSMSSAGVLFGAPMPNHALAS